MITEHSHSENNDWQVPGGEQSSASEDTTSQPVENASSVPTTGQEAGTETHDAAQQAGAAGVGETASEDLPSEPAADAAPAEAVTSPAGEAADFGRSEAEMPADEAQPVTPAPSEEPELETAPTLDAEASSQQTVASVVAEEVEVALDIRQPNLPSSEEAALFPLEVETPLTSEEAARPFTSFIEEFRQTESHFHPLPEASTFHTTTFVAPDADLFTAPTGEIPQETVSFAENTAEEVASMEAEESTLQKGEQVSAEAASAPDTQGPQEELLPGLTQPRLSPERPVSPLLRPATRPRVPRHGRHRIDELIHPAELRGDLPKPAAAAPAPVEEPTKAVEQPEEPKVEEPATRPARRYRFDRPAPAVSATPVTPKTSTPARSSTAETRAARSFASRTETPASAPVAETPATAVSAPAASSPAVETAAAKGQANAESPAATTEAPASPAAATHTPAERRRRSHEKAREKEQQAAASVETPEPVAPVVEPVEAPVLEEDVVLEDLPPLEYSELQAANSRRRRRRRAGSSAATTPTVTTPPTPPVPAPVAKSTLSDLLAPAVPTPPAPAPVASSRAVPTLPPESYNIVSGYTMRQMNQGNDISGPFMGPEPSPARGSTFTPSSVRPLRNEALRSTPAHNGKHSESPTLSTASVNHLANVVSQAMQTQTDRMVAELRRANQVPTNVSVSLPPFPSTERVGVFVDVANLLYSARTLRITVDFGKLLDFLRGNRRLVRAQAYCPTSPQPGDDQMFLQAVKGLGYRITTKNYKTFSSGAKKADLDLDLCMDVVRLVDGKAVDCIVLVSGDSDFMPMLDYCSDHGVRVEVAAFDESMSATLRQSCDLFVNLSMLEEIRL